MCSVWILLRARLALNSIRGGCFDPCYSVYSVRLVREEEANKIRCYIRLGAYHPKMGHDRHRVLVVINPEDFLSCLANEHRWHR